MAHSYLFSDVDWFSVEQHQQEKMRAEIAAMDGNRILNSSIEDLCDYLYGMYQIEIPELRKEGIFVEQDEKDIDVSHERDRSWMTPGPHFIRGTEVSLTIPFLGESEVFKIRPSRYSSMPPAAEVSGATLILRVAHTKLDPKRVRSDFDRTIAEIDGYLINLRENVSSFHRLLYAASLVRPLRPFTTY